MQKAEKIVSSFILSSCILLTACASGPQRDYTSSQACFDRGIKADSPDYASCMQEERSARMLEQQRREFEQRKAEEEYWRQRRYQ